MSYDCSVEGFFTITPSLKQAHLDYLTRFSETRRMKRNKSLTAKRPDPVRKAVGLPVGVEGGFFVGEEGYMGQDTGPDVLDHNQTPRFQPTFWCGWHPDTYGANLQTGEPEGLNKPVEWVDYLLREFFIPWGYKLNGEASWDGEYSGDAGEIVLTNNELVVYDYQRIKVRRANPLVPIEQGGE